MHVKKGAAVGGELGETVIVRGGGGKDVEAEEEEEEGGGGLWGVKVKRARCLGIFQFLRPVWVLSPAVSLAFSRLLVSLLPFPSKATERWEERKVREEEAVGYRSK